MRPSTVSRLGAGAFALAVAVTACGAQPIDPTAEPSSTPRVRVTPRPTPLPTPSPTADPAEVAVGEPIEIVADDGPWAELLVTEAVQDAAYTREGTQGADRPSRSGYVFMAANLEVTAVADAIELDPTAVRITVEGEETEQTYSDRGPGADLLPASLAAGDVATGWVIWEVPPEGQVTLTYEDDAGRASAQRVVLREA